MNEEVKSFSAVYMNPSSLAQTSDSISPQEVLSFIDQYGSSSTSFFSAYDGFKYFKKILSGKEGMIAYVETATAWVGASDPLCPPELAGEFISEFGKAAQEHGKAAILLPVSAAIAHWARENGHFAIQIGSEPWFSLNDFDSKSILKAFNMAKQLKAKGAEVHQFRPAELTAREHLELESLTAKWLESRKSVPLSFLNRLEPWLYINQKAYFKVSFRGHAVGYLSAIPVPARKAWYLVDLIRSTDSPVGTTELLITESMRILKAKGAKEVTLGMSPLAQVDSVEFQRHPWVHKVLRFIFEHVGTFYSFKTLYRYKAKFNPNRWESLYLIGVPKMGAAGGYGLYKALYPKNIFFTLIGSLRRATSSSRIKSGILSLLTDKIVLRPLPDTFVGALLRSRVVLALAAFNISIYLVTVDAGWLRIRNLVVQRHGYSIAALLSDQSWAGKVLKSLISSSLHWGIGHLLLNLVLLFIFGGLLEIIMGSRLVMVAYMAASLITNPIMSLLGASGVALIRPDFLPTFTQEIDIGSSLGVFSLIGALCVSLKQTHLVIGALSALLVVYVGFWDSLQGLNHIIALFIGVICAKYYLRNE